MASGEGADGSLTRVKSTPGQGGASSALSKVVVGARVPWQSELLVALRSGCAGLELIPQGVKWRLFSLYLVHRFHFTGSFRLRFKDGG